MTEIHGDTRAARTRRQIVAAFNRLVLDRSGEAIRVADVIDAAGVGRSTFYEHFRNIDDLHTEAASFLLESLADGVTVANGAAGVAFVLGHFRENRRMALATLQGPAAGPYARRLADLIEMRLVGKRHEADRDAARLAATAASEATLALVRVWLAETAPGDVEGFARAVCVAGRSAARALLDQE